MTDGQWRAAYAENESVWLASDATASDKQNAWRAQKVLLAHAARNLSESSYYAVLKEHQDKLEGDKSTETFMQNRLDACRQLMAISGRRREDKLLLTWPLPDANALEHPCRGIYESCKHDETNRNQQQRTRISNKQLPQSTSGNVLAQSTTSANDLAQSTVSGNDLAHSTVSGNNLPQSSNPTAFYRTAREQLMIQDAQKNKQNCASGSAAFGKSGGADLMNYKKKSLGGRGRTVHAQFMQPVVQNEKIVPLTHTVSVKPNASAPPAQPLPASLAHLDVVMVEQIMADSMHKYKYTAWEDIAGMEYAKATFMETIIYPLQRPDLFRGVRRPPRGVLLFGPPGTGKTLIAKCIASQSKATFFSINPSTLTSKWVGEGEKLVKTLFAVAAAHQPAIIFMDEVDSLLSQRSDNEHESSRRLKNEFFIQLDGAATNEDDSIMIIGATNRPQELDEAVRRRFVRRIYVRLPTVEARKQIIEKLVKQIHHNLNEAQIQGLAELTEGYSGADMDSLCRYAAMQPLRVLSSYQIDFIDAQQLPAVTMTDFMTALQHVSKSVSSEDVDRYVSWNELYGIKN